MSRRHRRRSAPLVLLIAWTVLSPRTSADDGTVVFRRMESLVETVGVTEVRVAYGARIDVPLTSCDAPRSDPSCRESRRFEQVVAIDLFEETRDHERGDGSVERVQRARAALGLNLDGDAERRLLEAIAREVVGRSAQSYRSGFAGIDMNFGAPGADLLLPEPGRAWICFANGSERTLATRSRTEVGTGGSSTGQEDLVDPTCEQMFDAVEGVAPRRLVTATAPLVVAIEEVRLSADADLPGTIWADEFPLLPEGSWLTTEEAPPGVVRASARRVAADGEVTSRLVAGGVRTDARVRPSHLPARTADHGLWAQRWIVERRIEALGAMPTVRSRERQDLVVGWTPVPPRFGEAPPDVGDDDVEDARAGRPGTDAPSEPDPGPFEIRRNEAALIAGVAESLDRAAEWSLSVVDEAVTDAPSGLESPGWMFVVCRPDGTAFWGLAPTGARAPVLDPAPICDEVSARVP